ncbi:MAG TPA: trigger factor [Candidatus Kapabacteria bacterium]|nr:trigger factor [Candidatus Kapabacteria bacterium]
METKLHERSAIARELEIFVDEAELQNAFDEAYKSIRPRLALPGFRPGKAPISLVKKMHGDSIEGETLEKLAQEKFRDAVDEMKLEPIGTPVMTDLHRHTGEGAHFKIAYEIAPEISIQDFNGMEVEQPVYAFDETDVEEHIHRVRFNMSTREEAETIESEEAIATLNMRELEPEEGKEPNTSSGVQVYLADPEIVPELKQQLIGKHVGDTIVTDLPKGPKQGATDAEPEKGRVELEITKVEKVILPEMTEDYIKQISRDKLSTEDELRADVKKELQKAYEQRSNEHLEENIVGELLKRHEFEVPRTVTHAILDQMLDEAKQENTRRGMPANYGIDEKDYRNRMWPVAEARGKWALLRDKLIEAESIEATDADLEELAKKEAEMYGLPAENLLKYYQKTESIKNRIVSEKLGKLLRDRVKINERKVERTTR